MNDREYDRESGGKLVCRIWLKWAWEQPHPKSSWLLRWNDLSESEKEVDRRIWEFLTAPYVEAIEFPP